MRVVCPRCQYHFNAKTNGRRIKCPECEFREDAPEEGFATALPHRKSSKEHFYPETTRAPEPGMNRVAWLIVGVLVVAALAAAAWYVTQDGEGPVEPVANESCFTGDRADLPLSSQDNNVVGITTPQGCILAEVYDDKAPVTAQNFEQYIREGFYDNTLVHRISKNFVIQAGGVAADGSQKQTRDPIPNEAHSSGLKNLKYTFSMARQTPPDTATSQFFINLQDNTNLDPSGPGTGYAVFAVVLPQSHAVVDAIAALPTTTSSAHAYCINLEDTSGGSCPVDPVLISKVRIVPGGPPGPSGAPTSTSSSSVLPTVPCASVSNVMPAGPQATVELGLITPGVWNVCANTDYMYVWVHNNGTSTLDYAWRVTAVGGSPLPAGWQVSFQAPQGTLQKVGTRTGSTYPDWAATLATLTIPADQPAGEVEAELHAAGATQAFTFHVQSPRGRVATSGEHIQTHYDLDDSEGNVIQHNGDFCVTLGPASNAVPGYGWGLIGVSKDETVTLFVPPPFAYGYSNSGLGGKTLLWKATVNGFSTSPPDPGQQCPQAT